MEEPRRHLALYLFCMAAAVQYSPALGAPVKKPTFYENNPTYKDKVDDTSSWKISTPEKEGLNPALLLQAADDLKKKKNLWSMVVLKNDALVFERYFNGSTRSSSNNIHSASKSILSALTGVALEKRLIPSEREKIANLIPAFFTSVKDPVKKEISLYDLLTMRSGLQWKEDFTEYEIEKKANWVQAIVNLKQDKKPGESFLYSTGNTHLMSAVLTKASNKSLRAFAQENLFNKMGIAPEHWGTDPQGYNSGGYNLYMTPREMAKFGLLYLRGGNWKGDQLVSQEWVEESLRVHANARPGFDYGYNWWIRNIGGMQIPFAWGYGGQFIYILRELDMVVVITTNTKAFTTEFEADYILSKYVIPAAKGI